MPAEWAPGCPKAFMDRPASSSRRGPATTSCFCPRAKTSRSRPIQGRDAVMAADQNHGRAANERAALNQGKRAPNFHQPRVCSRVAKPEVNRSALISAITCPGVHPSFCYAKYRARRDIAASLLSSREKWRPANPLSHQKRFPAICSAICSNASSCASGNFAGLFCPREVSVTVK